jgi:hypothetical protein
MIECVYEHDEGSNSNRAVVNQEDIEEGSKREHMHTESSCVWHWNWWHQESMAGP